MRALLRSVEMLPALVWWVFGAAFVLAVALWWSVPGLPSVCAANYWVPAWMESGLRALFYSIQMVAVNLDVLGALEKAEPHPSLDTFRISLLVLGILLPFSAVVGLIKAFFYDRIRPTLFRWAAGRMRDHVVIVGAGRTGRALLEHYLANGQTVCVIEREGYTDDYRDLFRSSVGRHLLWIGGDVFHKRLLASLGVPRRIYITAGSDERNLNVLDALLGTANVRQATQRTEVLVYLRSHAQREALEHALDQARERGDAALQRFWVRAFCIETLAARSAFLRYWPCECSEQNPARLVLLGDSVFAEELLSQIARLAHFDVTLKTQVRWVVPEGSAAPARMLARNPGLHPKSVLDDSIAPVIELDVQYQALEHFSDQQLCQSLLSFAEGDAADVALPQRVFACAGTRAESLWLAQVLNREIQRFGKKQGADVRGCSVVAAIEAFEDVDPDVIGEQLSLLLKAVSVGPGIANSSGIVAFELLHTAVNAVAHDLSMDGSAMLVKRAFDMSYGEDAEKKNADDLCALKLTDRYVEQVLQFCGTGAAGSSLEAELCHFWCSQGADEHWANRDNVDHMLLKIAYVMNACRARQEQGDAAEKDVAALLEHLRILYMPEAASSVVLARWSMAEFEALMVALSGMLERYTELPLGWILRRIEHRRWAAFKLAQGWIKGTTRDNTLRQNPLLVSFDDLPEYEQTKDAMFIQLIPVVLRMLWSHNPSWQQ